MSERLPRITGSELVKALKQVSFEERGHRGSHLHLMRSSDGRRLTIPVHAGRILPQSCVAPTSPRNSSAICFSRARYTSSSTSPSYVFVPRRSSLSASSFTTQSCTGKLCIPQTLHEPWWQSPIVFVVSVACHWPRR